MNIEQIWVDEPAAKLVADFHEAFNHPIRNEVFTEVDFDTEIFALRKKLINEEHREMEEAIEARDVIGFIDALQDLKYVIYGAELALGISAEEHFAEVHEANMRKLGADGKPIYREDGKVMKPEGWTGPDHQAVLDNIGQFLYF